MTTNVSSTQETRLSPVALEGALTRDGGYVVIGQAIERPMLGDCRFAVVGDEVHYPDGRIARIVTGSRAPVACYDSPIAVVGSVLDNGDVIVKTPHDVVTVL